jgi:hypothetical protein
MAEETLLDELCVGFIDRRIAPVFVFVCVFVILDPSSACSSTRVSSLAVSSLQSVSFTTALLAVLKRVKTCLIAAAVHALLAVGEANSSRVSKGRRYARSRESSMLYGVSNSSFALEASAELLLLLLAESSHVSVVVYIQYSHSPTYLCDYYQHRNLHHSCKFIHSFFVRSSVRWFVRS